jgi:c-di-AMP phosphodiesterase-like protein
MFNFNVEINGFYFNVDFLSTIRVLLFFDTTKEHFFYQKTEENSIVIGSFSIDNINNTLQTVVDEKQIQIENKLKIEINAFNKQYKALLIGKLTEGYHVLMQKKDFDRLHHDKFPILERIRELGKQNNVIISLSGGFSSGNTNVRDLYTLADESKKAAVYRGGDQIIIRDFGGNSIFYGAKRELHQVETKSGVRFFANHLLEELERASVIFIMGHKYPDFDSLASMMTVAEIAKSLGKKVFCIANLDTLDDKISAFMKKILPQEYINKNFITPSDAIKNFSTQMLLVVVDANNVNNIEIPELLQNAVNLIIIDHHRSISKEVISVPAPLIRYINPHVSSTAEILIEVLYILEKTITDVPFL